MDKVLKRNGLYGQIVYTGYLYNKERNTYCIDVFITNEATKKRKLFKGIVDPNAPYSIVMTKQQAASLNIDLSKQKLFPSKIDVDDKEIAAERNRLYFLKCSVPAYQDSEPFGPIQLESVQGTFWVASQEDLQLKENEI